MTASNLKSELTSLLSEFEISLYDAFSKEKIPLDTVAGFLYTPLCRNVSETLNPDGIHSWKKYTYDCRLEITGNGNVYEASLLIFKALNQSGSYKNVTMSSLSLSKITKLPSVEIAFQIVETSYVTYEKKDEDMIFIGLSGKGIVVKFEESDVVFTPSVVLATGERYYGESKIHGRKITTQVRLYHTIARNICDTLNDNVNYQTDVTIGSVTYNTVRFEKVEILENDGFTAVLKLTFYI